MDLRKNVGTLIRCCLCTAGSIGVVSNCIGIFYSPISSALGVGLGAVSAVVMMMSLSTAASSLVFARLKRVWPLKRIMVTGILLDVLAFFIMGQAHQLTTLYLGGIVLGFGASFYGALAVSGILRDSYGEKNGTALGIALAVSGVVGAILNPILSRIITASGYAAGLSALGIIIAVCCLPAALTMPVTSQPSGTPEKTAARPAEQTASPFNMGLIILLFCTAACFYTQNGMNTHISSLAVSSGYSLAFSAASVSFIMIGNTCFKLLFGALADRSGPGRATQIFLIIGFCGTLSMLLRQIPFFMILGPMLFGANFSCSMIGTNLLCQRIAGDHYTDIYARMTVMTTLAYAGGTTIYGFIRDRFGSYQPALIMVALLAVTGFTLTTILTARMKKEEL